MNRKAQKFSLKFLINLILALVVFIPAIMFAGKLFRLSGDAMESFNNLVNTVNELGSSDSLLTSQQFALRMDLETMIAFFNSDQDLIEVGYEVDFVGFIYEYCVEKPIECESDNCACLFKKYTTDSTSTTTCYNPGEGPSSAPPGIIYTGTNVLCKAINLKPTQNLGGFALFRGEDRASTYTVERAGNFFNTCQSGVCIGEEITNQINVLQSFKESYDSCADKEGGCVCSSFKPSELGAGFRLELVSEEDNTEIKLIGSQPVDEQSEDFGFTTEEEEYASLAVDNNLCSYNPDNQQSQYEEEIVISNPADNSYSFLSPTGSYNPSLFFTNSGEETCLLKKNPNEIYYHNNENVWKSGETDYAITRCGYEAEDKLKVIFVPVNSEVDMMTFNDQVNRAWTAVNEAFDYDEDCKKPSLLEKIQVDQSLALATTPDSTTQLDCYLPEYEDYFGVLETNLATHISSGNYLVIGVDDDLFTVESPQFGQVCSEFVSDMGVFVPYASLAVVSADMIEAVIPSNLFRDVFVSEFYQYRCLYS